MAAEEKKKTKKSDAKEKALDALGKAASIADITNAVKDLEPAERNMLARDIQEAMDRVVFDVKGV